MDKNKNKSKYIFKSLGIIGLMLLFSSFFFMFFNINTEEISDKSYVFYLTISNLILLAIFVLIYHKTLISDFKSFFKNFTKNIDTSLKYWSAGFAIMVISNLFITFVLNKTIAGNEETVRNYIDTLPLFMIFNTVIYAPIVEELTFRKSIRDAISNKWIYVITSGLIFGLLHIMGYITNLYDLVYLIPYGALGISFALLYYKTNNIWSTISMHAMHNFLAVVVYLIGALLWKSL